MPNETERGNHDYVDTIKAKDETHEAANLAKSVYYAEKAAINKRREFIKEQIGRSPDGPALLFQEAA
jgi:hypothetical protein